MKYVCDVCGWVYDEEEAGVKWEELPEDFACELCGVGKEDFSPAEQFLSCKGTCADVKCHVLFPFS